MTKFHTYVAIGDSTTEGLEDPYPDGGYRGWADRLAQHIADAQDEPLNYANLAVRGLRLNEIRTTQLEAALALDPDLMTIVGGVNDVIGLGSSLTGMRQDLAAMFEAARSRDVTVLTFTMPDPAAINPIGTHLRERVSRLNQIIRSEAARYGALVLDFERYPVAQDPRLWFEDRLHGNELGHQLVAAALAWRLGIAGFDQDWAEPLTGDVPKPRGREQFTGDFDWTVHYLVPWLGKGIRRIPHGLGVDRKRPVPRLVPQSRARAS